MMKKTMKKKNGKKSSFGMLSVKAGIDKNPKPTAADRIAGATKGKKKMIVCSIFLYFFKEPVFFFFSFLIIFISFYS